LKDRIALPLCLQINKAIHFILNMEYFGLYNWFQADNNNMSIFFLMNGNIFNYSLSYPFIGYAIPPNPPASTYTTTREPIFAQSYINAYNTAFNQPVNRQNALSKYLAFTFSDVNSNFIPGTFGYAEGYTGSIGNSQASITIHKLQDDLNVYFGTPYLFVSAGSGGGSGFMYLNWVIVTYGVPYVISLS